MELQDIQSALHPESRSQLDDIQVFEQLDSTNLEAIRQHQAGRRGSFLIVADSQTAGRGRRGRPWVSPSGGLYLSLSRCVSTDSTALSALSLVAAMGVVKACRRLGAVNIQLKWPNDVLAVNKKLAGVLLEASSESSGESASEHGAEQGHRIVFGIGINLNLPPDSRSDIDRPVTDLLTVCGKNPGQAALAAALTEELLANIAVFEQSGFGVFQQSWNDDDRYRDRDIVIRSGDNRTIGRSLGVNEKGLLLLRSASGLLTLSSGEIFPSSDAGQVDKGI